MVTAQRRTAAARGSTLPRRAVLILRCEKSERSGIAAALSKCRKLGAQRTEIELTPQASAARPIYSAALFCNVTLYPINERDARPGWRSLRERADAVLQSSVIKPNSPCCSSLISAV